MTRRFFAFPLFLTLSAAAFAQTGRTFSNAPTDQDFRLTVIEPRPNATIAGKDLQIVLQGPSTPQNNRYPQSIEDAKQKDINTPVFQVWVDGKDFGNLPGGQNAFVARDLPYGPHKVVVAAKNISGEVVDRKEISVTTVESAAGFGSVQKHSSAPSSSVASQSAPDGGPGPAAAPPASARAQIPSRIPSQIPSSSAGSGVLPPGRGRPARQELPRTGTGYPLLALVGVILVGSGVVLRRP